MLFQVGRPTLMWAAPFGGSSDKRIWDNESAFLPVGPHSCSHLHRICHCFILLPPRQPVSSGF